MQKLEYNGWYNYETWNLKLWLDNDQDTYNMVQDKAKSLIKKHEGVFIEDAATELEKFNKAEFALADWLKEYTLKNTPELKASFYSDVLNASIREVNFHEIAKHICDDILNEEIRKTDVVKVKMTAKYGAVIQD